MRTILSKHRCYICNILTQGASLSDNFEVKGKLIRKESKLIMKGGVITKSKPQPVVVTYCRECYDELQKGIKLYQERKEGKHGDWLRN